MYELAEPQQASASATSTRARCPAGELGVLQRLAEGKVYKQIAHELTLSTSTVRTHLHNVYGSSAPSTARRRCS